MYEDYKHSKLVLKSTNKPLELDVYVAEPQIAFEYQGEQHYERKYWLSDFEAQKRRDDEKKQATKQVFVFI